MNLASTEETMNRSAPGLLGSDRAMRQQPECGRLSADGTVSKEDRRRLLLSANTAGTKKWASTSASSLSTSSSSGAKVSSCGGENPAANSTEIGSTEIGSKYAALKSRYTGIKLRLSEVKAEADSARSEVTALSRVNAELEADLSEAMAVIQDLLKFKDEAKDLRIDKMKMERNADHARSQRQGLREEARVLKEDKAALRREIDRVVCDNKELKKHKKGLELQLQQRAKIDQHDALLVKFPPRESSGKKRAPQQQQRASRPSQAPSASVGGVNSARVGTVTFGRSNPPPARATERRDASAAALDPTRNPSLLRAAAPSATSPRYQPNPRTIQSVQRTSKGASRIRGYDSSHVGR